MPSTITFFSDHSLPAAQTLKVCTSTLKSFFKKALSGSDLSKFQNELSSIEGVEVVKVR
jgi:hypothetical protein